MKEIKYIGNGWWEYRITDSGNEIFPEETKYYFRLIQKNPDGSLTVRERQIYYISVFKSHDKKIFPVLRIIGLLFLLVSGICLALLILNK